MDIAISSFIILAMLGGFGWLSWLRKNRWQPKRKLRALTEGPLAKLARWGFKPTYQAFAAELTGGAATVPVAMIGTVQKYAVEVSFGWNDQDYLLVRVFFEPPSRSYNPLMQAWRAQQKQIKQWQFAKGFFKAFSLSCAPVHVDATFSYANSPPEPQELLMVAESIIKELRASLRVPLAYEAACDLATNVSQESKRRIAARKENARFD